MAKLKEKPEAVSAGDLGRKGSNVQGRLLSFVERYERLTEEIDGLSDDRKEVMAEAKGEGFDTAIMRLAIRRRKLDPATRQEADSLLETYEDAIRQAEKAQYDESERNAGDPLPKASGWGRKPAADPRQIDIEDVTQDTVQAEAARQIGHAADHPEEADEMPSFLRRNK